MTSEVTDRSLSELMAEAARALQGQRDTRATMQMSVDLAVKDIDGADAVAMSVVRREGAVQTLAASGEDARRGDELQYELGQGPCLDAVWAEHVVHSRDFTSERRWPEWAAKVVEETGFRSLMAFRLFTTAESVGALNLYSTDPDGFDATDRDYGLALAAHVAVAVRGAQEVESLRGGLDSRSEIGKAIGIVMERYRLDDARAFGVLTRLSTSTNRKLRDIAAEVVSGRPLG